MTLLCLHWSRKSNSNREFWKFVNKVAAQGLNVAEPSSLVLSKPFAQFDFLKILKKIVLILKL